MSRPAETESFQPGGRAGHDGSGVHPFDGIQPGGIFGQPGGGLKTIRCSGSRPAARVGAGGGLGVPGR